jgi:hypothetical protein
MVTIAAIQRILTKPCEIDFLVGLTIAVFEFACGHCFILFTHEGSRADGSPICFTTLVHRKIGKIVHSLECKKCSCITLSDELSHFDLGFTGISRA